MKEILKLIGYYKVDNYIDIFSLSGIYEGVSKDILIRDKKNDVTILYVLFTVVSSLLYLFYLLSQGEHNVPPIGLLIILLLNGAVIYPQLTLEKKIKRSFKKITRKNFGEFIKEEGTKEFINEYYMDIRNKKLSKKETIAFLKNWKKNKELLDKERKEKEVDRLTKLISNEEEITIKSKEAIKEAKEKLKELK